MEYFGVKGKRSWVGRNGRMERYDKVGKMVKGEGMVGFARMVGWQRYDRVGKDSRVKGEMEGFVRMVCGGVMG